MATKWNQQQQGAKRRRTNQNTTRPQPAASNPNKNTKSTDTRRNSGRTVAGTAPKAAPKPAPKQTKPSNVQKVQQRVTYYTNKNKPQQTKSQAALNKLARQKAVQSAVSGKTLPLPMQKKRTMGQTLNPLEQMKADSILGKKDWSSRATVPPKKLTAEERKKKNQQTAKQSGFNARARKQTLSQYDQRLPQGKRFQIQQAKQRFDEAKAKGDSAGMEKAHREAENLRYTAGYSGGATGNERIAPKLSQDDYNRLNASGRLAMTQAQMTRDRATTEDEIARADRRIAEILNAPGYQNRGRDINTARGMRETAEGRSTILGATREQKEKDAAGLKNATMAGIHLGAGGAGHWLEATGWTNANRNREQNLEKWLRDADDYESARSDLEKYDTFVEQFGAPPDDLPNRNAIVMRLNNAVQAKAQLERMQTDPHSAYYDETVARRLGMPTDTQTYWEKMIRQGQQEQAASAEGLSPAEKWINDLYISGIQTIPTTVAALIPGGQGGALAGLASAARGLTLAGMGASAAGNRMTELQEAGYAFDKAYRDATISGIIEAGTEMIGVEKLAGAAAGKVPQNALRAILEQGLAEGGEEALSYALNTGYNKAMDLPGQEWSWKDFASQVASGAVMGAVHMGAGVMVNSLAASGTVDRAKTQQNYQAWQARADQARSLLNDAKQWYSMPDQGAVSREEAEAALSQVSQQINGQAEPVTREWLTQQEELLDIEENAIRGAITRQEARDQQSQIMDQAAMDRRDAEANLMAAEWDEEERQRLADQNALNSSRTRLDQTVDRWRTENDSPSQASPFDRTMETGQAALQTAQAENLRRAALADAMVTEEPPVSFRRSGMPPTSLIDVAIDAHRENVARREAAKRQAESAAASEAPAAEPNVQNAQQNAVVPDQVERSEPQTMSRLDELANTFGESGAANLRSIGSKMVTGQGAFVRDFTDVYNQVLGGRSESQVSRPAGMSDANYFAAVTAAQNDRQTGWDLDILKASKAAGRNVNAGVDWRDQYVRQMDRKTARIVDALAKALGVKVVFAERGSILTAGGARANAEITGNVVRIEKGNPNPVRMLIGHELTHRMQDVSPESYRAFRDYVMSMPGSMEALERTVSLYQGAKAFRSEDNARQMAMDEVTADFAGSLLENSKQLQEFIRRNYENRTMLEVIRDFFRDLAAKLTGRQKAQADEAVRLLEEAIKGASARVKGMERMTVADEALELSDVNTLYSIRKEDPPKKTGVAYKVFFAKNGQLYPPMVANPNGEGTPVGVWLNADVGQQAAPSKSGRQQVKAGGKGTQGGSGSLAFRPGWHLGDIPRASQFDRKNPESGKKELFPANFVWAECEYAADVDYQDEAMSYGYTENGKFRHAYAGLPRLPENGYYRYRTNPKPDTVPWIITGAMRVTRILTDAETDAICQENGVEPAARQGGPMTAERMEKELGIKAGDTVGESKRFSITPQADAGVDNVVAFPQNGGGGDAAMDKAQLEAEINSAGLNLKSKDNNKNNLRIRAWIKENHHDLVDKVKFFNDKATGTVSVLEIQTVTDFERQEKAREREAAARLADEQDRAKYGIVYTDDDFADSGLIRSFENRDAVVAAVREYLSGQDGISDVTVHKSGGMGSFATFYVEGTNADDERKTVRFSGHDSRYYGADVYFWNNSYSNVSDLLRDIKNAIVSENDARYSLGTEGYDQAALLRENQKLKEKLDYWRGQVKKTDRTRVEPKEVRKLARKLAGDYQTTMDTDEITRRMQEIYDGIGKDWTYDQAYEEAGKLARDMVEQASATADYLYNEYEPMRKFFKDTPLVVTPEMQRAIPDYNDWRKARMGRLRLQSGSRTNVDQVFQEISEQWPEFFDEMVTASSLDQLERIAEVMDEVYSREEYNPFGDDMAQPAGYLAADILESFYDVPSIRKTFADRAQDRLNREISKRNELREKYQEKLEKVREDRDRKLKKKSEEYLGRTRARSQRQKERELRAKIVRHCSRLSAKLKSGTDKQHVPEVMQRIVATALDSINLSSGFTLVYDENGKAKRVKDGSGEATKRTEAFEELRNFYQQIITADPDENLAGEMPEIISKIVVSEELPRMIDGIIGFRDTPIANLGKADLDKIWETVKAIETTISTYDKALGQARFETISEPAFAIRDYASPKKDRRNYVGGMKHVDRLLNVGMLKPIYFLYRLGDGGKMVWKMIEDAQGANIRYLDEIRAYQEEHFKPGLAKRLEKQKHTFNFNGQDIELTTAQLINLYNLRKSEEADGHILEGGFRPDQIVKGIRDVTPAAPWHFTADQIGEMLNVVAGDAELVRIADAMMDGIKPQAAHGNAASMDVYGIKKYRKRNYWPIEVDKNQTQTDVKNEAVSKTVAGSGFAKARNPHANNAIILRSAFDVYDDHVVGMAKYAAWLGPIENLRRILNFRYKDETGHFGGGVKEMLAKIIGKDGPGYYKKLMDDLNAGIKATSDNPFQQFIGSYKAAAIAGNIRVVAQQPTSIMRALAEIDPQDFLLGMAEARPGQWENEIKKYAPIAIWKDWGYFTADTGRQMRNIFWGDDNILQTANNFIMNNRAFSPGAADAVTWTAIWNAIKRETKRTRKDLDPNSEEFMYALRDRFNEVINLTQVVDGIPQRSQLMRSENDVTKMATSFMGEPTTTYNMATFALHQARTSTGAERGKAMRDLARTTMALVSSIALVAAAQSLVDAMRDDDKDESYWEKFFQALYGWEGDTRKDRIKSAILNGNLGAGMNPLTYIPFIKDVVSKRQGYKVTRMDMDIISRVMDSYDAVVKAMSGEGKKTKKNAWINFIAECSRFLGVPVANIKRDILSGVSTVFQATGNYRLQYELEKFLYNIEGTGNFGEFAKLAYLAKRDGDTEAYEAIRADLIANGPKSEKDVDKKIAELEKKAVTDTEEYQTALAQKVDAYNTMLEASQPFQALTKEQQEKARSMVNDYAEWQAFGDQVQIGEKDQATMDKIQTAEAQQIDPALYATCTTAFADMHNDKDADGNDIEGQHQQDKVIRYIQAIPDLTNAQRSALYHLKYDNDKNNPWA